MLSVHPSHWILGQVHVYTKLQQGKQGQLLALKSFQADKKGMQ